MEFLPCLLRGFILVLLTTHFFMNSQPKAYPYCIASRAVQQLVRRPVSNQAGDVKYATGRNQKLKLRKECKIGTWYVRKLKESGKLNTICSEMKRTNIQVLGLCETNWNSSGNFKTTNNNSILFTGKEQGYSHGVGIMLTKELTDSLLRYIPVN